MRAIPPQGGRKHPQQEYFTSEYLEYYYLFAAVRFLILEKVIRERSEKSGIGFSAKVQSKRIQKTFSELLTPG